MNKRGSGILLHLTSLPSSFGIGDLGPEAYRFVDLLVNTQQRYWQVLPIHPVDTLNNCSPYSSISAHAGNELLISPAMLVDNGFLSPQDISSIPEFASDVCEYPLVIEYKKNLLNLAYEHYRKHLIEKTRFEEFCTNNRHWLDDFALFLLIKKRNTSVWTLWPPDLRDRKSDVLTALQETSPDELEQIKFTQYMFYRQWTALKDYCKKNNILLIGDLPIYVSFDSADVWTHQHLFKLDTNLNPLTVAGVPPDYFCKTGQRWGNPIYRWDVIEREGYRWWMERIGHCLSLVDIIRIDHFRGFVSYWEVPASEQNAVNGSWVPAPAENFFTTLLSRFPEAAIIAEDLGMITDEVRKIMGLFNFPGMRVLLFAFGEDNPDHPYLPHSFVKNCVVYTGTHDNNTVRGWYEHEAAVADRNRMIRYFGHKITAQNVSLAFVRQAMMSIANTVIIPMQDVLGLGQESRMNIPSTIHGNWQWRLTPKQITPEALDTLKEMTIIYGRGTL